MVTLTPQARAVAAFTLAILLVEGTLNRITVAFVGIFGDTFPEGSTGGFVVGLFSIAVGLAVLGLAMSAANGLTSGWELNLAQAARILALIGLVIVIISTFNATVHESEFGLYPFGIL